MAEQVKRKRGRPFGAKDRQPRKVKPETPPVSAFGASPEQIDEMIEDLGGNGRDEAAYETASTPFAEAVKQGWRPEPEQPAPSPQLTKLFIAAVENGYIIRPAYSDGYKGAADNRSWVVSSREELVRMVSWLVAERGAASPDMLGGPYHMPQPTTPHYAPPVGLHADETVG